MSRRRELSRRLAALTDIANILSAMKSLAVMEVRILHEFLDSQRRMVDGIEAAATDFLAWHGEFAPQADHGRELWVLVGSEQGFCGDFNEAIAARCADGDAPPRWVAVGQRLAAKLEGDARVALELPGATVADEVPTVLLRLTEEINALAAGGKTEGFDLSALYHCETSDEIRLRRLLPLRDLPPAGRHPDAPDLNLAPGDFLAKLTGHYLHAALNEVLYSSLMAENRQRQAHMDSALQHLDEETARLRLAYNIQRQEDITEEIEVILLSADMLEPDRAHRGGTAPAAPRAG